MVMHQEYLKIVLHWPVWLYNMRFQEEAQGIEKSRGVEKSMKSEKKKLPGFGTHIFCLGIP